MKKKSWLGFLLGLTVLLTGCASVPMSSLEDDNRAKSFAVKPGKANIYVIRTQYFGGAIPITLSLNGKVAGQSGPRTYFKWEVDPGTYEVASQTENVSTLKLTVEEGKNYYIWQEVQHGTLLARSSLYQLLDEEGARKGLLKCTRAQSAF